MVHVSNRNVDPSRIQSGLIPDIETRFTECPPSGKRKSVAGAGKKGDSRTWSHVFLGVEIVGSEIEDRRYCRWRREEGKKREREREREREGG